MHTIALQVWRENGSMGTAVHDREADAQEAQLRHHAWRWQGGRACCRRITARIRAVRSTSHDLPRWQRLAAAAAETVQTGWAAVISCMHASVFTKLLSAGTTPVATERVATDCSLNTCIRSPVRFGEETAVWALRCTTERLTRRKHSCDEQPVSRHLWCSQSPA